jgi:hypothetical protein
MLPRKGLAGVQASLEAGIFTVHQIAGSVDSGSRRAILLEARPGASLKCTVTAKLCRLPERPATASGSEGKSAETAVVNEQKVYSSLHSP